MPQRRPILAWLLLVAFAAGGVVGPPLHQVQHGAVQIANQSDEPCHTAGVHNAEGAVWTKAAVDLVAPDCVLCATRLLVVPPTPVPTTAPRIVKATAGTPGSHVATAAVASHRFIRGPPSL